MYLMTSNIYVFKVDYVIMNYVILWINFMQGWQMFLYSCSYMFLYYIRKNFVEAKMFLYFLILFSLIMLLQGCKSSLFENHL